MFTGKIIPPFQPFRLWQILRAFSAFGRVVSFPDEALFGSLRRNAFIVNAFGAFVSADSVRDAAFPAFSRLWGKFGRTATASCFPGRAVSRW